MVKRPEPPFTTKELPRNPDKTTNNIRRVARKENISIKSFSKIAIRDAPTISKPKKK